MKFERLIDPIDEFCMRYPKVEALVGRKALEERCEASYDNMLWGGHNWPDVSYIVRSNALNLIEENL